MRGSVPGAGASRGLLSILERGPGSRSFVSSFGVPLLPGTQSLATPWREQGFHGKVSLLLNVAFGELSPLYDSTTFGGLAGGWLFFCFRCALHRACLGRSNGASCLPSWVLITKGWAR